MAKDATLGGLLRLKAREFPAATFASDGDRALTFAEMDVEVDRLVAGLRGLGIGKGDHVALWTTNSIEWVLVFLACARLGAPVIPVNTRYKIDELSYILKQSDARLLVMTERLWSIDYYRMLLEVAPELAAHHGGPLDIPAFPELRHVVVTGDKPLPGTRALSDLLRAGPTAGDGDVAQGDLLIICYTSGTTGRPKGVMHNHRVIAQATRVGQALHMAEGDRVLAHMPFYHVAGLFMALIPALALGAELVIMQEWRTEAAIELIERRGVTVFGGIPTHYFDLVQALGGRTDRLPTLKSAWIGGASVGLDAFQRFKTALGKTRLLSTYGMTENTISTTFNRWDDPAEKISQNMAPVLGDGRIRIVDTVTMNDAPPGQNGEIWCSGDTVMLGYYKNPAATAEVLTPDGWLRTGDIGNLDSEGYLSLTGRVKDMFKVGGTNAYPAEIEAFLGSHPAVVVSVVVGVPDERLGEVGYAFVQTNRPISADELKRFCKDRIADYKIPRHVAFVDDLPRTSTGKIARADLATRARADVVK